MFTGRVISVPRRIDLKDRLGVYCSSKALMGISDLNVFS
jgi:hypothetical protein